MTDVTSTKNIGLVQNDKIEWSFWLGLVFFVVVISLISVGGWRLFDRMMANEAAPISTIQVSGEMPYTNKADITKALAGSNVGNFFQLDVNNLQKRLEALPWVKSASVRKQWPSQLSIYLVDHVPAAVWNQDHLLSETGDVFEAEQSRVKVRLPHFYGPEGSEDIALNNFKHLNGMLALSQMGISEISLSARYAWRLTLNDGVVLNLGREERVERVQRFIDVYPQILEHKNENQQVNYVDLRYDTGVAVGWKQAEDERV